MKKFLSLVLALVMTMSLVTISAGAKDFTDNSKIAYKEAVDVVSALKIVDGYTDGSFNPQNTLTRGAAAKIICNLILGPTTASALSADAAPFKDVPANHEFAGYIAYCAQQGIINGYADGTFRPAGTLNGYAFMKMLLGALGYDGSIEKYTGANWSVNVAKQALGLSLDKGNDEFVGSNAVTREEACLYAFNTLNATMVEYENTSSIVIGDVTVNTSSKAKEMENNVSADNTIKKDGKMQFAEKYFDNLKKEAGDSDEFERPATTWKIKSTSIGTYSDTPDASYTAEVKMGDVYKDLGLSSSLKVADVTVYEDGKEITSLGITKGDTSSKLGGNGVLTEVFYDDDNDTAVITLINTYLGKVTAIHKASGSRDAYITVETKYDNLAISGGNFETDESFDVDDLVLFNYTHKEGDKGVQNVVADPESVTGTLSSFTAEKNVTVSGTTYKANKANKAEVKDYQNAVDNDVTIYLDPYGYVLFVDTDAVDNNYAVVVGLDAAGGSINDRAKLLFTDGTTATVAVKSFSVSSTANGGNNTVDVGDIVSYTKTAGNEYKITLLSDKVTTTADAAANYNMVTKSSTALAYNDGSAQTYLQGGQTGATYHVNSANGKTIFLIATKNGAGDTLYNVYNGIANVPTVTVLKDKTVDYSAFVKGSVAGAAKVIFIDATDASKTSIAGLSKDAIFVKGGNGGSSYDSTLGTYWEYDAIINGSFEKIKTDSQVDQKTLFGDGTVVNGVYTLNNGIKQDGSTVGNAATGRVGIGTGIDKSGDDVVVVNTAGVAQYLVLSDNYKVYRLNEDGDIDETAYSSFSKDANDIVWYKTVDGEVTTLVIYERPAAATTYTLAGAPNFYSDAAYSTSIGNSEAGKTVYVDFGAGVTATSSLTDFTTVNAALGRYSFTMPARNVTAADFSTSGSYVLAVAGVTAGFNKLNATVYNTGAATWTVGQTVTVKALAKIGTTYAVMGTLSHTLTAGDVSAKSFTDSVVISNDFGMSAAANDFAVSASYGGETAQSADVNTTVYTMSNVSTAKGTDISSQNATFAFGTPVYDAATGNVKVTVTVTGMTVAQMKTLTVTATGATAPAASDETGNITTAGAAATVADSGDGTGSGTFVATVTPDNSAAVVITVTGTI